MIILGIDSSSVTASCALMRDGEVLSSELVNNGLTHSQTLLPMIKRVVEAAEISVCDIDIAGITLGPGSFTGLRIGMSTLKGICAANNTKCVGISTLEALSIGVCDFDGIVCAVMDARAGQVYNALFFRGERMCDDRAISIADLEKELKEQKKPVILVGDGTVLCYNRLKDTLPVTMAEEKKRYCMGTSVAVLAQKYAANAIDAEDLTPVYLRLPQAQRELNNRKELTNK